MARFNTPPPCWLKGNVLATLVRIFVLAAFLVTAVQSSAFAEWKNLQVLNHTGFEIKRLYISSSGSGSWGKDLLGNKTLKNGSSTTISYNADYRFYDVRVDFMNDKYWYWMGDARQNFDGAWRITIYHDGKDDTGDVFRIQKN